MRMSISGVSAALAAFVIGASAPAMASTFTGPQDTTVDWQQEFCLTDCTTTNTSAPITSIDVIMATPGVTFTGISSVFSNVSETSVVSGATTAIPSGGQEAVITFSGAGDTNDVFLNLDFSPAELTTPFTFYWEQFEGSTFITTDNSATSSDMVTWTGSTWIMTPMTAPVSMTPLPPGAPLFVTGLGLLAFMGFRRKGSMALGENAPQVA